MQSHLETPVATMSNGKSGYLFEQRTKIKDLYTQLCKEKARNKDLKRKSQAMAQVKVMLGSTTTPGGSSNLNKQPEKVNELFDEFKDKQTKEIVDVVYSKELFKRSYEINYDDY